VKPVEFLEDLKKVLNDHGVINEPLAVDMPTIESAELRLFFTEDLFSILPPPFVSTDLIDPTFAELLPTIAEEMLTELEILDLFLTTDIFESE